jgi:hypothetical protein
VKLLGRVSAPDVGFYRRLHATLTVVWFMLAIPTVLWWHDSVLWVGLISCYANAVGHFAAYQGSRAEAENDESKK